MSVFFRALHLLFVIVAFSACQREVAESGVPPLPEPSPTLAEPTPGPTTEQRLYSSIRNVDFQTFDYIGPDDCSEPFTLQDGEKTFVPYKEDGIFLEKILYEDLTNDGREEAIVRMSIQTGGSAIPHLVFLYTLKDRKPMTLWKFCTGDRAEGGLKDVFAKGGILIVEMFGENRFVNGTWESTIPEGKFKGLCCPTVYTKTKFKWNGEHFAVDGTPEIFDIAETNSQN